MNERRGLFLRYRLISMIVAFLVVIAFIAIWLRPKKEDNSKTSVKVAEVTHSIFYAPLYVADGLGYFDEEDLDVEIILTSGADAVASAVLSGDVEIGFCGSEQSIYIYNGGYEDYLVNFAGLTKRDGSFIVSRDDSEFSLEDLVGKKILGGREGGMPAMTLAYTLYENGIDVDDVDIDTSVAFAAMSGSFIGGNGDYVTLFEPTAMEVEKQGYGYVVASVGKLGGEVPYTVFNAKKSYIEENPEVIKGFSKAIQRGIDYVKEHSDKEVADVIGEYFPDVSRNDLIAVVGRYREADSWYDKTFISEEGFERIQDIMIYNGVIEDYAPFEDLVNNSFAYE